MRVTKIKICGLYRLEDAQYVNEAMPDYAGLVFYPKSHRNVTEEMAVTMRLTIKSEIATVGVFVDAPLDQIVRLYSQGIISIVQLHGCENGVYIASLRKLLPRSIIWKAYQVRTKDDLTQAQASLADMVLLDNGQGTGACFDWSLLEDVPRDFILAGGLTAENIPFAIAKVHPLAVDLSSGVETQGKKDREKIRAAVSVVKGAE